MGFSEKLKEARLAAHMTQNELATELGVSTAAVRLWEHGMRQPGLHRVNDMARVLGVTFDELMANEATLMVKRLTPGLEQLLRAKKMYSLTDADQKALKGYIEYLYSKKQ